MKDKVKKEIIDKASSIDLRDLIKWGLIKKSGSDYFIYYDEPSEEDVCFEIRNGRYVRYIKFNEKSEMFYIDGILLPHDYLLQFPIGKFDEFAEVIINAVDLDCYWDEWANDNPIISVARKPNKNNLLSALVGTPNEEVDIRPYLAKLNNRAKTIERVFEEDIDI